MSAALHAHTPTISAVDGRGLAVRSVAYHRVQDQDEALALITRMAHDAAGRVTALWDPRLWAIAEQDAPAGANRTHHYSLSGVPLLSESVDAGTELVLPGEAGNLVQRWDSRASSWQTRYDANLRPVAVTEIDAAHHARIISRLIYADNSDTSAQHNQCGQLARSDDAAGSVHFAEYSVLGQVLSQSRQFLKALELPDWTDTTDYLDLVETEALSTQWRYDAAGAPVLQTDAKGHVQRFAYTPGGDLRGVYLRLNAQAETTLVDNLTYNPFGQVETQTAGNGVVSQAVHEPSSGLLQTLNATGSGGETLQSLRYGYDPVGKVIETEDSAQSVRFFANQRIEPISHYRYDTLYRLTEATGREVITGTSHGPALPGLQALPPDPNQLANYTQRYDYDAAGNLLQMRHVGAQSFTRTMRVAPDSNRSLPEGEVDVDFADAFDANGNLLQLVRGQGLEWDLRNQLQQIGTVIRAGAAGDNERYVYDGQGQRCRKVNSRLACGRTLSHEVRYLPGLEIRTTADGEILYVVTVEAGHGSVRVLRWQAGQPAGIDNDQIRYSLSDHLGSSTLELDRQGGLISQESYYPFGGTSWWAARSAVEAKYKTVRYSGKERDAGGLYYYGFRYYAPWLQRWINPDPAGDVNGLNLFCFVGNNPVTHRDLDGRVYSGAGDPIEKEITASGNVILYRGLDQFPDVQRMNIKRSLSESRNIYQNAVEMITFYPSESAAILRSFFGYRYADVLDDVTQSLRTSYLRAAEYASDEAEGRFLGFTTANERLSAFVFPNDPLGRIAIQIGHADSPRLTHTIGHELTHLDNILESTVTGPAASDAYYIHHESTSLLVGGGNTTKKLPYQAVAEVITGGGMSTAYLLEMPPAVGVFIEKVRAFHPQPDSVTDLDSAVEQFNRNPGIAARVSAHNADSLTHAARHLHEHYTGSILRRTRHSTSNRISA